MILTNLGIEFEPEEEKVRYTIRAAEDDNDFIPDVQSIEVLDWGPNYENMDCEDEVRAICTCLDKEEADKIAFALNLFNAAQKAVNREQSGL